LISNNANNVNWISGGSTGLEFQGRSLFSRALDKVFL
jgi:hypothetical protein